MARDLNQILQELDASYNPQRQSIQSRIDALPGQADADIAGLQAQQGQAFNDITAGARNRGLGFSGIPLSEQAQYTSTQFLPAVAKVKQANREQATSLFDALNNVNLEQNKYAQNIRQAELDRDEQQRQFNEGLRAQRESNAGVGGLGGLFGGSSGGNAATPASATATQRADKGYNFTDASGNAISAAQYAQKKGIPFRSLLQQLANSGDAGAKTALNYVGDDFGVNKSKLGTNSGVANILNSLLWGVNSVQASKAQQKRQPNPSIYSGAGFKPLR